ncbi:Prefoldin subunit-domain-containing protein [Flagelloscypha sp. PMI_526]|nr:Prefoldin subunit-domain-containing protein [Flagelloscypha sp. PMI_526]
MSTDLLSSAPKNPRGIPKAPFIDDPAAFVLKHESTEAALTGINDALAKYKYMESSLSTRRAGLEQKIPDIRKTLDMVQVLFDRRNAKGKLKEEDSDDLEDEDDDSANQPLTTTFELNDTLYAEATLDDTDEVYLWLGANVMLSYPLPQALTLLKEKLSAAGSALFGS